MTDTLIRYGGAAATALGLPQAAVLAQIVIRGDGLGKDAQLALVIGLVLTQLLSIFLAFLLKRRRDDD